MANLEGIPQKFTLRQKKWALHSYKFSKNFSELFRNEKVPSSPILEKTPTKNQTKNHDKNQSHRRSKTPENQIVKKRKDENGGEVIVPRPETKFEREITRLSEGQQNLFAIVRTL